MFAVLIILAIGVFAIVNFDLNAKTANNEVNFVIAGDDYPPFVYKSVNGTYTGFDIDVAQEVCNRNNWTLVVHQINWFEHDAVLNNGSVDCIWDGFSINGRENNYTWTDPYFNNKEVFIVSPDSNITSIDDLNNTRLEVQDDTLEEDALKNQNKTFLDSFESFKEVDSADHLFMDLKLNQTDVVIADESTAMYYIQQKFIKSHFKILNQSFSENQYAIAFKKGNTDLKNQVQQTLYEMYNDGTMDKIASKYSDYRIDRNLIHY